MASTTGWLWPVPAPPGTATADPLEIVGWAMLLGFVFFWAARKWRRRKAEEQRRAIAEENRRKARRLYEEAYGAGNFLVIDEVVAEEFFDHHGRRRGQDGLKLAIASLRRTFPDLRISVVEQSAKGDTVITRCTLRGTDRGGVLWYPPTSKRAAFAATYTDRFSGGALVEHRGGSDTAGLLEQLGLPPSGG